MGFLTLDPISCCSASATFRLPHWWPFSEQVVGTRQYSEVGEGEPHHLSEQRLRPLSPTTAVARRTEPDCCETRALETDCVRVSDQLKSHLWEIISLIHSVIWRLTSGFTALPLAHVTTNVSRSWKVDKARERGWSFTCLFVFLI